MEPHNLDTLFRKAVNESQEYYSPEAENARGRIWQQVVSGRGKNKLPFLVRVLSAACILLLFCSTLLAFLLVKEKHSLGKNAKVYRNAASQVVPGSNGKEPVTVQAQVASSRSTDTVYIHKTETVYQPIFKTEKRVDTVYIRQVEYRDREPVQLSELAAVRPEKNREEEESPVQVSAAEKEILISNKQSHQQKKKGKLMFRLGGAGNPQGNGSLALTVKL